MMVNDKNYELEFSSYLETEGLTELTDLTQT
jgi:hypothetical protein